MLWFGSSDAMPADYGAAPNKSYDWNLDVVL